jgi:hypothetical protein
MGCIMLRDWPESSRLDPLVVLTVLLGIATAVIMLKAI